MAERAHVEGAQMRALWWKLFAARTWQAEVAGAGMYWVTGADCETSKIL